MGAYSPAPALTPEMEARVMRDIVEPTLAGMRRRGTPFAGILYAGLMLTAEGPKLIEYNVRFGDPECQVLMPRLKSDVLEAMLAACDGRLDALSLDWSDEVALAVVLAARGYPGAPEKGSEIRGLQAAERMEHVLVFHAGTTAENGRIVANGGRVLNVTAIGRAIGEAQERAYAAVDEIDWPEGFCRRDIGWRAVERERARADPAVQG
jgi:phosphoribosylamine--glycine ligase